MWAEPVSLDLSHSRFVETVRRILPIYDHHGPPGYWKEEPSDALKAEYSYLYERLIRDPLETMDAMVAFKRLHADWFPMLAKPQTLYPNSMEVYLTPSHPADGVHRTGFYGVSNLRFEGDPLQIGKLTLEYYRGFTFPSLPLATVLPRAWSDFPTLLPTPLPSQSCGLDLYRHGEKTCIKEPNRCPGTLCLTVNPTSKQPPGAEITILYDIYEMEPLPSIFTISYSVSTDVHDFLKFSNNSSEMTLTSPYSKATALRVVRWAPYEIIIDNRPVPLKCEKNKHFLYEVSIPSSVSCKERSFAIQMKPCSDSLSAPTRDAYMYGYSILMDIQNTITFKDGVAEEVTYWL